MRETRNALKERYRGYQKTGYHINMERGWPCREQLDLSMPMLDLVTSETELEREVEYRGYAGTGGIEPIRELFAEILDVGADEIYVGGTMSTTIMYDLIGKAFLFGFPGCKSWKEIGKIRFICPSPGYEKHFKICMEYGIEMVAVPMRDDGPDMDMVEELVKNDASIKGIWCVPLYSNPTGAIYSDETVTQFARMETAAEDFHIFWDNAYCVHHLTEEKITIRNIIRECEKFGCPDRVFEFASTSKITFPGGGVGVCASSRSNIEWLIKRSLLQLKSGDKVNQLRHALFLKDLNHVNEHMKKHRDIIKPKFDLIDHILHEELDGLGAAEWVNPKGGYFINLVLKPHMAKRVWQLCKDAGVDFTPAGSTFPYGMDEEDRYLRLAPTWPKIKDLETAMRVLCAAIKIAFAEIYEEDINE